MILPECAYSEQARRTQPSAATRAERGAERSGDGVDDGEDRPAEDEEHDEQDQREVLRKVDVDLSRPAVEVPREDARAIEPGDRQEVEDEQDRVEVQDRDHEALGLSTQHSNEQ